MHYHHPELFYDVGNSQQSTCVGRTKSQSPSFYVQGGARTVLDVLGAAYGDTPKYLWSIAAGNVLLHVGRLEKLGKLPKVSVKPSREIKKRASLQRSRSITRKSNELGKLPNVSIKPLKKIRKRASLQSSRSIRRTWNNLVSTSELAGNNSKAWLRTEMDRLQDSLIARRTCLQSMTERRFASRSYRKLSQ
jgi:hypothetical protein